jgi:glycosyltransferase involved in cell wall biosynthesis
MDGRKIRMLITFVIPAFNASNSIRRTLDSVFGYPYPGDWTIEAVVVDDGSSDGKLLAQIVANYPSASLIAHTANRGMCAARNTGITHSRGDLVSILDADDEMVQYWPDIFKSIIQECPTACHVIYAACRNQLGDVTASDPEYHGLLSLDDVLNERHSGEYLPIFRGNYVRNKLYVELQMRKSCGIVSYINYALDGPFWVSNKVLRIYHEAQAGSVSEGWTNSAKAMETVRCYQALLDNYGDLYKQKAPRVYLTKMLRLSIYLKLAGLPKAWKTYRRGVSITTWHESLGAAVMLCLGAKAAGFIAKALKKIGMVRKYG